MYGASANLEGSVTADGRIIKATQKVNQSDPPSGNLVQVNPGIPNLGRLHHFVPPDLVSRVSRRSRHHTGKSRFGALGGLIMETAARDALDERLLFFRIGELEIGAEAPRDRERLGIGRILRGGRSGLPRFVTPDAEWSSVGRLGCA